MIEISPSIKIKNNELHFEFIRASGPGGQNVNKVSTAVRLRFDVTSSSLPSDVKSRLRQLGGKRLTEEGMLLIESAQFRTQEQNREEAIKRFTALIRKAAVKPKSRKKTKPTQASLEARLSAKKKRGEIKKNRRSKDFD
jgi:ribosome-associated protein